jgi:hypothetical protein
MNLSEIEVTIYDRLNLGVNPDSVVQRYIRRFVNDTYREVLTKKNIGARLRRQLLTFTTSATSPFCVLPQAVSRIFIVTDRTNNNLLDEISLQDLRYTDPGLTSSSAVPYGYVIENMSAPVAADPAAATALKIISDNASDGSGVAVNVEGVTSDGQLFKASSGLNGLTQASIGSVATWLQITKFYLSSPAQGHVSLKDSSGNVLGVISPGRQFARYTRLHMVPTSTSALTLTVDCELRIEDMMTGSDESLIPEDFHDILIEGALAKEYRRRSKATDAGTCESLKKDRVKDLQVWLTRPTGVAQGNNRQKRFSQLGSNFPPGT